MSRTRLPRTRRILIIGAIGLLFLLTSWFDSTRNATRLRFFGQPPLPKWGFGVKIRSGKCSIGGGVHQHPTASSGAADIEFRRAALSIIEFGFDSSPDFKFDHTPVEFNLTVPHWLLVLLYLVVWLGILGWPRLREYLKQRRPTA